MCRSKLTQLFARSCPALWVVLAMVATNTRAQDYSSPAPTLYVTIDKDYPEALVSPSHAHITAGTNHMLLKIPEEWRATVTPALAQIELLSHSGNMKFTATFLGQSPADFSGLDADTYRNVAIHGHPGATVRGQFSLGAAGGSGPCFDLDWTAGGGSGQCSRTAYILTAAGVIEFSAVSSADQCEEMRRIFTLLTNSFWIGADGKREAPRIHLQGN
jgi:hypothetical protein